MTSEAAGSSSLEEAIEKITGAQDLHYLLTRRQASGFFAFLPTISF